LHHDCRSKFLFTNPNKPISWIISLQNFGFVGLWWIIVMVMLFVVMVKNFEFKVLMVLQRSMEPKPYFLLLFFFL
jgi:hypothetical protein